MQELFRRRRLPHWDVPGATYFVTTCLAGSIPAQGLLEIEHYRRTLARQEKPAATTTEEFSARKWKQLFVLREHWLDERPAARHLADAQLADMVVESICHFAGERYELWSYVVMPSHVHWVFRPLDEWAKQAAGEGCKQSPREIIQKSLNSYTAKRCNVLLQREGPFWQRESFDHWIRDDDELERVIHYVKGNPVKASLIDKPEEWPHSSASDRLQWGIPFGRPIVPPRQGA